LRLIQSGKIRKAAYLKRTIALLDDEEQKASSKKDKRARRGKEMGTKKRRSWGKLDLGGRGYKPDMLKKDITVLCEVNR